MITCVRAPSRGSVKFGLQARVPALRRFRGESATCRFEVAKEQKVSLGDRADWNTAHQDVKYIAAEDLSKTLDSFDYILDVSSPQSYVCSGHVPSTKCVNIPVHDFMSLTLKRVAALLEHRDRSVLVLSNRGRTAASVQMLLTKALGFSDVTALEGGMEVWRELGLPVEFGTDCKVIMAHCPWLDNSELMCSLKMESYDLGGDEPTNRGPIFYQ